MIVISFATRDIKWLGNWSCWANYTIGEWKNCNESCKHYGYYGYEPPQNREMSIQVSVCPAGSYAALAGFLVISPCKSGRKRAVWVTIQGSRWVDRIRKKKLSQKAKRNPTHGNWRDFLSRMLIKVMYDSRLPKFLVPKFQQLASGALSSGSKLCSMKIRW